MKFTIVFALVLVCSLARAQSDSAAIRLLDDPGIPTEDIDYVYDYLENTPTAFDSSARYHLRSSVIGQDSYSERGNDNALFHTGSNEFKGAPEAYRNRLWMNSTRFTAAISEQKKPWEPSFTDRINGYLALRSLINIMNGMNIDQAVIGRYSMGFGSGLLFGDLSHSNRREHVSDLPIERGLRGSLSGDPFFANYGGAATIGISDRIALTGFYSNRKLDARVSGDSILTLYEFADHRTDEEIALQNTASFMMSGGRVAAFNSDTSQLGISGGFSACHGVYDHYYSGTDSHPFFGKSFDAASMDAAVKSDKIRLLSEAAMTSNDTMRRVMYIIEGSYRPSQTIGVAAAYRHIPFGIVSPFGQFLGKPLPLFSNQDGYYLGIDAMIVPNVLRASAYADIASELLPIGDEFARQKYDYGLALHSTNAGWNADLTIRSQRGEETVNTDSMTAALNTQTLKTTTTRLDLLDTIVSRVIVGARFQNVMSSNDSSHSESGWFARLGCKYQSPNQQMSATVDVGRFSTPSYRSAVWTFQPSVHGAGRFLALYGNGYYLSVGMQIHISKIIDVRVAVDQEFYDSWRMIGSGLTQRNANSDQQMAVQLDLRF